MLWYYKFMYMFHYGFLNIEIFCFLSFIYPVFTIQLPIENIRIQKWKWGNIGNVEGSRNSPVLVTSLRFHFSSSDWRNGNMKQPDFFDVDEHLARLRGLRNQREAFSRAVDFWSVSPRFGEGSSLFRRGTISPTSGQNTWSMTTCRSCFSLVWACRIG